MSERQAVKLTIDDKQKNEMQKEVFILIRLIDMVEKCFQLSYDRITPEEHSKQISKLIEKYDGFKSKIPNFNLNTFVTDYNLEDCRFGLGRIEQGPPRTQDKKQNQLVKLSSKFYQMQDQLMDSDSIHKISKFKPISEELMDLLQKAQNILPPYNSYLKEFIEYDQKVFKQKQLMESLTEDEFEELNFIVTQAQRSFLIATNN